MQVVNYKQFRNNLKATLDSVSHNSDTVIVSRGNGNDAVIISLRQYRRISDEHRLVYKVYTNRIHILQCRYHYGD